MNNNLAKRMDELLEEVELLLEFPTAKKGGLTRQQVFNHIVKKMQYKIDEVNELEEELTKPKLRIVK